MEKITMKTRILMLILIVILVLTFLEMRNPSGKQHEIGLSNTRMEDSSLAEVLTQIEGVGEVAIYFHSIKDSTPSSLASYFAATSPADKTSKQPLEGVLVIAEGASDPVIKNELTAILSTVLQLPAHRVVIVEMKHEEENHENK